MSLFAAQILLVVLAAPVVAQEGGRADSLAAADSAAVVDLSGEEYPSLQEAEAGTHVLARPWYQNVEVSGFGAFWFVKSGRDGTRPEAGFVIKESSLFVEAEAWEDVALFFEIQTNVLQRDHNTSVRTGEVYAHFRNVLKKWGDDNGRHHRTQPGGRWRKGPFRQSIGQTLESPLLERQFHEEWRHGHRRLAPGGQSLSARRH